MVGYGRDGEVDPGDTTVAILDGDGDVDGFAVFVTDR